MTTSGAPHYVEYYYVEYYWNGAWEYLITGMEPGVPFWGSYYVEYYYVVFYYYVVYYYVVFYYYYVT